MEWTKQVEDELEVFYREYELPTIISKGNYVSDYVKDYFHDKAFQFTKSKVDQFRDFNFAKKSIIPKEERFLKYLKTILKNYMIVNIQRIKKETEFRDEVFKKYYRDKKLESLLIPTQQ